NCITHIFPPPLRREGLPASGERVAAVEFINQLTQYNCMGLDMWLEEKTYVQNWDWTEAEDPYQVTVLRGGKPTVIRPERVSEVASGVLAQSQRHPSLVRRECAAGAQTGGAICLTECAKAAREMKEDPSEPAFRSRFQTTPSCCGQEP